MNNKINFLSENREELKTLYFKGLEEKEAIKKRLFLSKEIKEDILTEYALVDNVIKSIARVVFL